MEIAGALAEQFEATRRPLVEASTLPPYCYTSPDWYAGEMRQIFLREWLCLGRTDQVAQVGDYFTIAVGDEPIVVVRDKERTVRAFSNVCRHRGAPVARGSGNRKTLLCPYHFWTYSLTGELIRTPGHPNPMNGVTGFRCTDYGLNELRTETWAGFIFVTFSATAPSLGEWLGRLPEFLANYRMEEMSLDHQLIFDVDCNWKVLLENSMESYHAPFLHRKFFERPNVPQNWQFDPDTGKPFEAMHSTLSILDFGGLPDIEGLNEKQRSGLYHIWVHPNFHIIATATYMSFRLYMPAGPEKMRIIYNWCFPPVAMAAPAFREEAIRYYARSEAVLQEDLAFVPTVQQTLRSRHSVPGRYSPQEFVIHRIGGYVIDRVMNGTGLETAG